jgi:hypothetical protein
VNLWFLHVIAPDTNEAIRKSTYDRNAVHESVMALPCISEERDQPVDASVKRAENGTSYEIVPEEEGNVVKAEVIEAAVEKALSEGQNGAIDLEKSDAYVHPLVYANDESIVSAVDTANKWMRTSITYDIDGLESVETLGPETISQWVDIVRDEPEEKPDNEDDDQSDEHGEEGEDTEANRPTACDQLEGHNDELEGSGQKGRHPTDDHHGGKEDVDNQIGRIRQIEEKPSYTDGEGQEVADGVDASPELGDLFEGGGFCVLHDSNTFLFFFTSDRWFEKGSRLRFFEDFSNFLKFFCLFNCLTPQRSRATMVSDPPKRRLTSI